MTGPRPERMSEGAIAIVSHTHPSVTKGGAEIAAYSLFEGLRKLGHDVIFIAACPVEDRARLNLGSAREFAVFTDPLRYDHLYQLASTDVWRQLKSILLRNDVRLVNFHHFLNFGVNTLRALASETDIPFVVTLHEFLSLCAHHGQMVTRPGRRLCPMPSPVACATCFPEHSRQQFAQRQALMHSALSAAAAFVSPSRFLAERMIAAGLDADRFVVIENGLRILPKRDEMKRTFVDGQPWTFGYFGQITPFKGVNTLIDAVELLGKQPGMERQVRVRIHGNLIGQTEQFETRFRDVLAANSFATYHGAYDNGDVHNLMEACDYIVIPSTWWENSPVVIQEAFAVGRPIICTGIGGMAEKVPHRRAGLHFRLGDGADLARVMLEAADEMLYRALASDLPPVSDDVGMARAYLSAFTRLAGFRPGAPVATPLVEAAPAAPPPPQAAVPEPVQLPVSRRRRSTKTASAA